MEGHNKNIHVNISNGTIVRILLFGLLILALVKLWSLVLVILTSIVIASFIESAVKKMKRFIKNRTVAVFSIYVVSILAVVGLFSVFIPVFLHEMSALVSSLGRYIPDSSILNSFQVDTISDAKGVVKTISKNGSLVEIIRSTQNLMQSVSGGFFNVFGSAFGGVLNMALILIISFYLSIKEKGIENFLRIITPDKQESYVIDLWQRTERKIGLWIQGQMLLGIIVGMLVYLGLTILGVKYSLVLALLAAFFELIPFGLLLATIPAVIFALIDGGTTLAFMVFGLYLIIQQFENYLIAPLIVKKVTGVPPLVVILSVLIGAQLAGLWGIILAIPCAVCLLEFLEDVEKKKLLSKLN